MTIVQDLLPGAPDLAASIDWLYVLKVALLLTAGICILGGILCLIFGKGSSLVRAVSACVSLVMIYLSAVILSVLLPQIRDSLSSLPFITVNADACYLWDIRQMDSTLLLPALLRLFILAFLVNVLETFLPKGKKLLSWYCLRMVTVLAGLGLYMGADWLIMKFAPEVFGAWAGWILLGFWALIALTVIIRAVLTVVLTVINPIIGGIYAFFFSNIFGKQFTKSILTTLLCLCIFALLQRFGFVSFAYESFSLAAYGPACLLALLALYLFGKLL